MWKPEFNRLFALIFCVLTFNFNFNAQRSSQDDFPVGEVPPNGIKIGDGLYIDQTEVTNFNWLEYMYWTSRVFGKNSKEYKQILPDTTVWFKQDSCLHVYAYKYLRHHAYRDYPVVGLSQDQAIGFSKWRSDRVMEYILVREKVLEWNVVSDSQTYFTIDKYFAGQYMGIAPDPRFMYYPEFRLPSIFERSLAFDHLDSTMQVLYGHCRSKKCLQDLKLAEQVNIDRFPCSGQYRLIEPTLEVGPPLEKSRSNDLIFHLIGNVSEWTDEHGYSSGLAWNYVMAPYNKTDKTYETGVNAWTGFRNVCEWKKAEFK